MVMIIYNSLGKIIQFEVSLAIKPQVNRNFRHMVNSGLCSKTGKCLVEVLMMEMVPIQFDYQTLISIIDLSKAKFCASKENTTWKLLKRSDVGGKFDTSP